MTALAIVLIMIASVYVFGLLFAVVVAAMKLSEDSALQRHEAWRQMRRSPIWPVDEFRRQRAEYVTSKHLANIEQSELILKKLEQVEQAQRRNLQTWEQAQDAQTRMRELALKPDDSQNHITPDK